MKRREFKSKTYFKYQEVENNLKVFEKRTKVSGRLKTKDSTDMALLDQAINIMNTVNHIVSKNYSATGFSKCLEGDTFNQKFGVILAGRKAEGQCYKKALDDVCELKKHLEEMLKTISDVEDKLDYKIGKCALDIIMMKRTGKTLDQIKKEIK